MIDEFPPMSADELQLRVMIANCYSGMKLYRDDGELQDNSEQPFIDFRRDTVGEINTKMMTRAVNFVNRLTAEKP